ncbi:MAG: RNA-binding S4 domain-containing protein [Bacteroidales bacterium]|nr:RNA-binding S4 domain-containing protein [Bacteroidales bacterium]
MDSVRIDKYLWAVRIYKTRSEATDACNGNKVRIDGTPAKPGKAVKAGEILEIHKGPAVLTYKVLQVSSNRMGAQLVPEFLEDLTPPGESAKLHAPKETIVFHRDKGAGRPTKKDRRTLDHIMEMMD